MSGTSPTPTPTPTTSTANFRVNGNAVLQVSPAGNFVCGGVGAGAGATLQPNATAGFLYIPTINGAPSNTPNEIVAGAVPLVYDLANNQLWVYQGGTWFGWS